MFLFWVFLPIISVYSALTFPVQPANIQSGTMFSVTVQKDTAADATIIYLAATNGAIPLYGDLSMSSTTSTTLVFSNLYWLATGSSEIVAFGGSYNPVKSTTVTVSNTTPRTFLYFNTQPVSGSGSSVCSSGVTIKALIRSTTGPSSASYSSTVTLALIAKDGSGSLATTTCSSWSSGACTISSCAITGYGTFVFQVSGGSATSAYSNSFTVTSGAPNTVVLNSVSGTIYRGTGFTVTGTVKDSNNVNVNQVITFYLSISAGNGVIASGGSATVSKGVLTFSNVVIQGSGSMTLSVTCPSCSTAPTVTTTSITVSTSGLLVVSFPVPVTEAMSGQYYQLSLSSAPSASVSVSMVSSDSSVLVLSTSSVTFTTSNYATPQNVYFSVLNIASTTNPYSSISITHSIASSDYQYNGKADLQSCMGTSASITIPIYQYQQYSVVVATAVTISELQQTQLSVLLGAAPTSDVTITIASSYSGLSLSAAKLIFTSSSWSPQSFSIIGPNSGTVSSPTTYSITYAITTSDANYGSASLVKYPSTLKTNVIVTPSPGNSIVLSKSASMILSRHNDTYLVSLSGDPSATVTVTISSSSSTNVKVSPPTLNFYSNYGTVPQEVRIYAADASSPTTPSYLVTISHAATSSDSRYSGISSTYTVTVATTCVNLPYTWPSGNKCTCQAGFDCQGNSPVPCPPGTYTATAGDVKCTMCPAGSYCENAVNAPVACASGYYSYEFFTNCYICPAGYACSSGNGHLMKKCSQGTYSAPGQTSCTTPTSGNVNLSPEYSNPVTCPTGYYAPFSNDACVPCPAGFSCSSTSTTACSAGTYALAGMGSCQNCPSDHECDPALGPTRICPEGTYRASGSYTCGLCPANSFCSASQASRPTACATGYSSTTGSAYCSTTASASMYTPGFTVSSGSLSQCSATSFTCYVDAYTQFTSYIRCIQGYGTCYPTPGGENNVPTRATSGKYALIAQNTLQIGFSGFMLPTGADRPDMAGFECPAGYYCTTSDPSTKTACSAGTFNPTVRGMAASDCLDCPPGFLCSAGAADYELYPCPSGAYCTNGVSSSTNCPSGTFRGKKRGISQGSCEQCPDGYYCPSGSDSPTVCPRGYICPVGSSTTTSCPDGTYNLFEGKYKVEDCILCPPGSTCSGSATTPIFCYPGTYNPYHGSTICLQCTPGYACIGYQTVKPYIKCSIGYYCPLGSKTPIQMACPPGTLGNMYGAYSVSQCEKCPPGFYCGYATNHVNNPPQPCPAGYYCPIGTQFVNQFPCPAGTYNDKTRREGLFDCLTCPAGYYCLNATTSATANPCPAGFFCQRGTSRVSQNICPAGTFRGTTGGTSQTDCTLCSPGKYCPLGSIVEIPCPAGTYMDEYGATSKGPGNFPSCKPCPAGYYSSTTGTTWCTAATVGHYTYQGATSELTCVIGYFCALAGTSEYTMYMQPCPAGYLCPAGTSVYPTKAAQGCPTGKYCPEGATSATPCPVGTYRKTTAAKSIYDCAISPAGYYVASPGTSDYSGFSCSAGYYCQAGSTSATQNACPKGTYRSLTGGKAATDCASCPPGYYCPNLATTAPTICPATQYCPAGTITPLLCPKGTYSTATGLQSSTQCTPCDAGKYCQSPGQSAVTGQCTIGYYCISGSFLEAPTDGVTGKLCPKGGYCPAGTTTVQPCTAGTFNNFEGGMTTSDCVTCWPGSYCAGDTNPAPTGQCNAGYYCTGGSSSATQNTAQAGYYAPLGSVSQVPCLQGTYNPSTAQSACLPCPAGKYCPNTAMTTTTDCPVGFYCLQGAYIQYPCPLGTYGLSIGLQSKDQCTACTAGSYCTLPGLSAVTGTCDKGYYCTSNAPTITPWIESSGKFGRCPAGYYCEAGTTNPTPCPVGTYNPSKGAEDISGCVNCPAGYACPNTATTTYSMVCRAGFYCVEASTNNQLPTAACAAGYQCPTKSAVQQKCAAGTYQDQTNQNACKTCPPGYYCPIGTSNYLTYLCPAGYYCLSGTTYSTQYPCPAGTFNAYTGQSSSTSCVDCSPGNYCNTQGASAPTGQCNQGFYCKTKSTTPSPTDGVVGNKCTAGYYCPAGSSSPTACDAGHFCPDDAMSAVGPSCQAGYYCKSASITPTPTDGTTGSKCDKNNYCAAGTSFQVQCAAGTYIPYTGASSISECLPCAPGYYCNGGDPIQCTQGYYCPGGDANQNLQCARGYYCPTGSTEQKICPAGTYQPDSGQPSCITTNDGYYAVAGSYQQTMCPKGYYCPAGTTYNYQYPCPPGTYNGYLQKSAVSDCKPCDAGSYCLLPGKDTITGPCDAGYYCTSGAKVSNPIDGTTGNICPIGFYCPSGSSAPTPCDEGYYCNQKGLGSPTGKCFDGYYCVSSATSPTPIDGVTGNICPSGNFCPSGSITFQPCQAGTYGPSSGMSNINQCINCPYGKYCDAAGLSAVTGTCTDGYFCNPGSDSPTPTTGECPQYFYCANSQYFVPAPCVMGKYNTNTRQSDCTICPAGSYCQGGTAEPVACPKGYMCPQNGLNAGVGTRFATEFPCGSGFYASTTGQAACSICPAGSECNNAAQTSSNLCPTSKYCPQQTGYGIICPPGTYNKDYNGLKAATDCLSCPAGQFCVDGSISGQCAAGFWCKGGSATPTPTTTTTTGLPCPPGYYCPTGTTVPTICPTGKFRQLPGARADTDCSSCPPGSYCISGQTTPIPCPRGYYCPVATQTPFACPKRTYNDKLSASSINDCKVCPPGYLCTQTGIALYTDFPCKPGFFCVQGATGYINCPPGTYTNANNAGSINDCLNCPPGFYCPANTTNIISCPQGSYCPGGNSFYWPCPPGYLCYGETGSPLPCPSGYYCPLYGSTNSTPPFQCNTGSNCPGAYFDQATCSPGSYYDLKKQKCQLCPKGYYSDGQKSSDCLQCQAGYICTGGSIRKDPRTSSDGGYPCPAGFFCPFGATDPIPCPIAYYNAKTASTSITDCLLCPNNTYGIASGQSKCKQCGPHAYSGPGSLTCNCTGLNRTYQYYDGSCICGPTYEYVLNGVVASEEDSDKDCTPISYVTCTSQQKRASDGTCVSSSADYCKTICQDTSNNTSSPVESSSGLCPCAGKGQINDVSKINNYPKVTINSKGVYSVYDPSSKLTYTLKPAGSNYLASVSCNSTCNVHGVDFTPQGPQGKYGVPTNFLNLYYSQTSRRLEATSGGVSPPLLCILLQDTVVFSLTPRNNFPVYSKNSLTNNNNKFDFSAFKELFNRMRSNQSNVDTFAFTFNNLGFYDFIDNANNNYRIIIKVVAKSSDCLANKRERDLATDTYIPFIARTSSNMNDFGLTMMTGIINQPAWGTIAGILVAVFIVLLVIIAFLAFLHWRAWASSHARERLLKLVKDCCKRCKVGKPGLVSPIIVIEDESDSVDIDKDLLEPSQFREMLDKLNTYYNELLATFDSQDEDAKRTLEDLLGQAKDLKIMLGDRLSDLDPADVRMKIRLGNLDSSDDEENIAIPEIVPLEVTENLNIALNAIKEADADNKVKLQQDMFNKIMSTPNLNDSEKADLMKEFENNLQRMEQVLDNDLDQAQVDINRRLQERAARRNLAAREKAYLNPKRNEIASKCNKELDTVQKQVDLEMREIEDEFVEERNKVMKENRKEVDSKLKEMRTQLQSDLMQARNQVEIDNLMKVFEIEAKRVEEQILSDKLQHESEMLARIEERRKNRLAKLIQKSEEKKAEIQTHSQEEMKGIEQRALLAFAKVSAEVQLEPEEENVIGQVALGYEKQKEDLLAKQQEEIQKIDEDLQREEQDRLAEKQRLTSLIGSSANEEERDGLIRALQELENAELSNKVRQEDRLKAQLLERKRRRAEKEAQLKAKHESELNDLDNTKNQAEKEVRSEFELRKMEQMIGNSSNMSAEELIAMARELLEAKHDRETAMLTTQKHSKLRERQNDVVIRAIEKKTQDKAAQKALFDSMKESVKSEKIDPASKKAKLDEIELRALEVEKQIDDGFILGINQEQDRIWRETEEDFKQQFNDLTDKQNHEIVQIMSKINGVDSKMLDANINDMQQEIDKLKAELGKKHAEKLRELDKRAEELKEIEKQRLLEIDFINSQLKETEEKQKKLEEVHQQRKMMEDRQRQVIEAMKERGISQEKMNEILEQHQREMNEWEKAMENERIRQQQKLQARLDAKRQKYNERKAQMVAKFKEETEKMMEKQAENEQNMLKIVFDTGRDVKLHAPKVEIETRLRFPDLEQEQAIANVAAPDVLDEVITRVRRVEKIAENIDSKQFNMLLKAFSDVNDMMEVIKGRLRK